MNDHSQKEFSAESLEWIQQIARYLLSKFELPRSEFDELVAAGGLGFVEASERYDPEQGVPFKNYAQLRVRGAMIDAIRKNSDLSVRGHQYAKALQAANDFIETSQPEVSQPGSPREKLANSLQKLASGALAFRLSIDDPDSSIELESERPDPEASFLQRENIKKLQAALAALEDTERTILTDYYFLDKPFGKIAEELEITKGWVSKIHKRALTRLQESLNSTNTDNHQ